MIKAKVFGVLLGMLGIFVALETHQAVNEHDNYYHLIINDETSCSAMSVGPHALLTATHCIANMTQLTIDGRGYVNVMRVMSDGNDHSVLFLSYTFRTWEDFGPLPEQAEEVHIYHSPGNYPDMYSKGYVSGRKVVKGKAITLYDLPTFYGSSGSAILDKDGKIIAVTSAIMRIVGDGAAYQQVVSWDFAFTPEQMEAMTK